MQKCNTHREFKQNVDFNINFCSGLKLCDTIAIKAGYINPKIQPNMKLMVIQNRLYQTLYERADLHCLGALEEGDGCQN